MKWAMELYAIRVYWDQDHRSPLVGPVVGITRARKLCTLVRQRLKLNKHPFLKVAYEPIQSPRWLMSLDAMKDPTDRLLADVFRSSEDVDL